MKKYRVYGNTTAIVVKEVWANNEDDAYEKAAYELPVLNAYMGNGGCDKLVGVEEDGESVAANDNIEYDDIELLEDNPDYCECPNCGEVMEKKEDEDREDYFYCEECGMMCDKNGEEIGFDDDEEEEE